MKNVRKLLIVTLLLGVLSFMSIIFGHLALTDIYHNQEPDLSAEWLVLRFSFMITLLFHGSVFYTIIKLIRLPR